MKKAAEPKSGVRWLQNGLIGDERATAKCSPGESQIGGSILAKDTQFILEFEEDMGERYLLRSSSDI